MVRLGWNRHFHSKRKGLWDTQQLLTDGNSELQAGPCCLLFLLWGVGSSSVPCHGSQVLCFPGFLAPPSDRSLLSQTKWNKTKPQQTNKKGSMFKLYSFINLFLIHCRLEFQIFLLILKNFSSLLVQICCDFINTTIFKTLWIFCESY